LSNVSVHNFGKYTPQQLLLDVQQHVDDIDAIVVIIRRGKKINCSWSGAELIDRLGMCDVAKDDMLVKARPNGNQA
jgi:hypothetical protein